MQGMNRREALAHIGFSVAGLSLSAQTTAMNLVAETPSSKVLALSELFINESRDGALTVASKAIADGEGRATLLGAILLAGAENIRPRPHGILHSVMMVESTFQLSDAALPYSARDAWYPILFNLDDFKRSQDENIREWDNYQMKALPADKQGTEASARKEFVAALEAFDGPRAERAVAAWAPMVDHQTFFALLRPYSVRCYEFIGHKMIHAVQVELALQRIGWNHAVPVLRSLLLSMLVGRKTDSFEKVRELNLVKTIDWNKKGDAAQTQTLLKKLLVATPDEARDSVISLLNAGVGCDAIWDAIVLMGSEIFARRPGKRSIDGRYSLLPVHALTVPSAIRSSFYRAQSDATRWLLILQAAALIVKIRDDLKRIVNLSMDGAGIEVQLTQETDLQRIIKSGSPGLAQGFLQADIARSRAYLASMRSSLARLGREHHQHKYAAAVQLEAGRIQPSLIPVLIAPAIDYIAHPKDQVTGLFERSGEALNKAGIPS